jgi:hypothetical protein
MRKNSTRSYAATMTRRTSMRRRPRKAPQRHSNAFFVALVATIASTIGLIGVVVSVMAGG